MRDRGDVTEINKGNGLVEKENKGEKGDILSKLPNSIKFYTPPTFGSFEKNDLSIFNAPNSKGLDGENKLSSTSSTKKEAIDLTADKENEGSQQGTPKKTVTGKILGLTNRRVQTKAEFHPYRNPSPKKGEKPANNQDTEENKAFQPSNKLLTSSAFRKREKSSSFVSSSTVLSSLEKKSENSKSKLMFKDNGSESLSADSCQEFFHITHIENLASILEKGILGHKRAYKLSSDLRKKDVSEKKVQEIRRNKVIQRPGSKKPRNLHKFVPLYLNPHNAMLHNIIHSQKTDPNDLCIISVHPNILKRGDVILTDRNAASHDARFYKPKDFKLPFSFFSFLSSSQPFGNVYNDESQLLKAKDEYFAEIMKKNGNKAFEKAKNFRRQVRQAEALVPYLVHKSLIMRITVSCKETAKKIEALLGDNKNIEIMVNKDLFFPDGLQSKLEKYETINNLEKQSDLNLDIPDSDSDSDNEGPNAKVTKLTDGSQTKISSYFKR